MSVHFKSQKILGLLFLSILIGALFIPWLGFGVLICMAGGILLSFFGGRVWCGRYCPRGSMLSVYLSRISLGKPFPHLVKQTWFRWIFLVLIFSFFFYQISLAYPDPYLIAWALTRTLILTTLLAFVLGIFYHSRTWCQICPVGTLAGQIGKTKKPLQFNAQKCVSCGACARVCPQSLTPAKDKTQTEFTHPDCIKCGKCIQSCPTKALSF